MQTIHLKPWVYLNKTMTMKQISMFLAGILMLAMLSATGQETYKEGQSKTNNPAFQTRDFYPVKTYPEKVKGKRPKNIILLIGDGMGADHVFAGITANGGKLFLDNFRHIGFSKTQSADKYITDSAAGGTALATGVRTYNGAISVDVNRKPLKTILEEAEAQKLATGLVSTSAITHATPASFIAHQGARSSYEAIAADFLKTDIDVFIGGGYKHFADREDGRNLIEELEKNGYQVLQDMHAITQVNSGKLAGLTAPEHNPRVAERGDNMLPQAVRTAVRILSNNKKGFFLMVEGSQIDWGGHAMNTIYVVEEMLDFDRAIGEALDFAARDRETLVIVTADHETGGMSVTGGNLYTGMVQGSFTSDDHTAVMVPVFAWGPGAEEFMGIMDNTDVHKKMKKLLLK